MLNHLVTKLQNTFVFYFGNYITIVNNNIIAVKGLSHKKLGEPLLINSDLLSVSSINPPSTKARIKGPTQPKSKTPEQHERPQFHAA